jgi:hypothetical protein
MKAAIWQLTLFALILAPAAAMAQAPDDQASIWKPYAALQGSWTGTVDGRLGTGTGKRSYRFILDRQFLAFEHESFRPAQENNPKPDHHRELSVYSYDQTRNTIVLRSFIVEGYVLQFVCTSLSESGHRCVTETIENGGPSLAARQTVTWDGTDAFDEVFEMTNAQGEFETYFNIRWTRAPAEPNIE